MEKSSEMKKMRATMETWQTLLDDLIAKIIARMLFLSIFKVGSLSKAWCYRVLLVFAKDNAKHDKEKWVHHHFMKRCTRERRALGCSSQFVLAKSYVLHMIGHLEIG